jgi:hypothetical protein
MPDTRPGTWAELQDDTMAAGVRLVADMAEIGDGLL